MILAESTVIFSPFSEILSYFIVCEAAHRVCYNVRPYSARACAHARINIHTYTRLVVKVTTHSVTQASVVVVLSNCLLNVCLVTVWIFQSYKDPCLDQGYLKEPGQPLLRINVHGFCCESV